VLSGTVAAIESAEAALKSAGLKARRLSVATAFHSPVVAASAEPFARFLDGVSWSAPTVPVYANASAAVYPSLATEQKSLLASQIARPVRFVEQVRAMHDAGARIFVEVGPQSRADGARREDPRGPAAPRGGARSQGRAGLKPFALGIAELAAAGVPLRLRRSGRATARRSTCSRSRSRRCRSRSTVPTTASRTRPPRARSRCRNPTVRARTR
jgi:acyl transferase domain-containing protein